MTAAKKLDPPTPLEAARALTARGWRVFPCEYMGKRPAVGIKWSVAAASAPTDATLALWFGRDPVNVAVAARWSNLVILDEDQLGAMQRLCAAYGQPVPKTYRVRTAKGWHWYFNAPQGVDIGNAPGLLAEFGFDVRGGRGAHREAGGYVVAAGSVHASGHVYTAEDDDAEVVELPEWIIELLLVTPPAGENTQGDDPWDNPSRGEHQFTHDQAAAYVKRHAIEPLQAALPPPEGKGRNNALNNAAVVVGHFVPEFWSEEWAVERLTELALEVGLERHEIGPTIRSGMRAGMADPYALVERDPFDSASDSTGHEAGAGDGILEHETAVRVQVARLRALREAEELLAAENRAPLSRLSFKEFLSAPAPNYLVPNMFYRDGLAVVFGAPGAAKSFLVLDIGLCLATGTPWRGRSIGHGRVHYVMAEGQATNTLRARAWLHHRNIDAGIGEEWFVPYTEPIMLTEAGIRDYLQQVKVDQPDMIILDTKNLMFEGKESQGDDYGAMLRALHTLRRAANGCAVVLIDHTGLTDDSRTRGSNAQKGGVETEIRVTEERGVRRAQVTRDKSGTIGTEWFYKLVQVDEVERPEGVEAPAVCVPVDANEAIALSPFAIDENWNDPAQPELPADVAGYTKAGRAAIKALARFMRYSATGSVGFSQVAARRAVQAVYVDERGKPKWSPDTIDRAWQALVDLGRLDPATNSGEPTGRSTWKKLPNDPEWPVMREMS